MADNSLSPNKIQNLSTILTRWNDVSNQQFLLYENSENKDQLSQNNILVDSSCIELLFYNNYSNIALILLTPEEELSSFCILKCPKTPVCSI